LSFPRDKIENEQQAIADRVEYDHVGTGPADTDRPGKKSIDAEARLLMQFCKVRTEEHWHGQWHTATVPPSRIGKNTTSWAWGQQTLTAPARNRSTRNHGC